MIRIRGLCSRQVQSFGVQKSIQTKKDVFADIMRRHHYDKSEVLVVGDDPKSEIKAAQDLGIDVVLYDKEGLYKNLNGIKRINDYKDLALEI